MNGLCRLEECFFLIQINETKNLKERKVNNELTNESTKHLKDEGFESKDLQTKVSKVDSSESSIIQTIDKSKSSNDDVIENKNENWNITLNRTAADEQQILDELKNGLATIKNITAFWILEISLKKEFSNYDCWNLPKIPYSENQTSTTDIPINISQSSSKVSNQINQVDNVKMNMETKLNKTQSMKLAYDLSLYLNMILLIPSIIRSESFIEFLSIPKKNKKKQNKHSHLTSNKSKITTNEIKENSKLTSKDMNDKTCYDYIFGDEIYKPLSDQSKQYEDQEFENGGIVTMNRRNGTYFKSIILSPDQCFLWRFRVLSSTATSISFHCSCEEAISEDTIKTDESIGSDDNHNSFKESEVNFQYTNDTKMEKVRNKLFSNSMIHEEHSCTYRSSDVQPYQGYYQNQTEMDSKITITFKNTSSLFRSAQISFQYQIVPYNSFKAACIAANDQNILSRRKQHAPILVQILDSNHDVQLKVEPLFLDDDNNNNNDEILKEDKSTNKQDLTTIVFEELLSNSWKSKRKPTNQIPKQNIQSIKKLFSTQHLQTIVKPYQDQIKILRRQLHQLASQFSDTHDQLTMQSKFLDDAKNKIYELRREKRIWNVAQREIEHKMNKLMGELNKQREQVKTTKQWRDKANQLEKENERLALELANTRKQAALDREEWEAQIGKEREESKKLLATAEMDADDAKMMKTVLEGKVREMERNLREKVSMNKLEASKNGYKEEKQMDNSYHSDDDEVVLDHNPSFPKPTSIVIPSLSSSNNENNLPDYITMSYRHPNPQVNIQLVKLRDRYIKLFRILQQGADKDEDEQASAKNQILLQRIALAVQEIMLSGNMENES